MCACVCVTHVLINVDLCLSITQIHNALAGITAMQPKDVRLVKDRATNTSRGFAFIETNTTEVRPI